MDKKAVAKNYRFLAIMLGAMVLGCIAGRLWSATEESAGITVIKPLGTVFINMMFCVVVPLVFASIAGLWPTCAAASGPARSWAPLSPPL